MHIYFSGIGGTAIGPLALIAKQAGHEVSGSDMQASQYVDYLIKHGIENIHIGQDEAQISAVHNKTPIDWLVHSSAVTAENPELRFCQGQGIRTSKRDELLNQIIQDKHLKLIAVAGTHGKTTTTAMVIWLFKELGIHVSYSVGAKIPFGEMGQYQENSGYFVYEADEFDRNFLAFKPYLSLITGVTWDHHEIFPTREDYQQAFRDFIKQTNKTIVWTEDHCNLDLSLEDESLSVISPDAKMTDITLAGKFNRMDAWLAIEGVAELIDSKYPYNRLVEIINRFPGLQRRMEQIIPNLYSDYAHTPEKIRGGMSVALEIAADKRQAVVVVYEPLTNRRQHHMINDYAGCFAGAKKVYWLPSYLAREDPAQVIISPEELISHLADPSIAEPAQRDEHLKQTIQKHLDGGDMVVCMAGGGGDSLDEWVRKEFTS